MNKARFEVKETCIGCGKCVRVCPGGILFMGEDKKPKMKDFSEFGWNGCWKCQHCLAVCPEGTVSVLGYRPEDSLLSPDAEEAKRILDGLTAFRRSCRRYQKKNVPGAVIQDMIERLANAPNGGNKQQVEYTLIDDMEQMDFFRRTVRREMERISGEGIYPEGFGKEAFEDMKRWEETVRPDMFFCGAPHVLIPHAPAGVGEAERDTVIAGTYFEILCASRGLGSVIMTFPLSVLELMPEVRALLKIPDNHVIGMAVGFGYPQIRYARGTQRKTPPEKVHRLYFD